MKIEQSSLLHQPSLLLTKFARTGAVTYRLLDDLGRYSRPRYLHRRSTSGDFVADPFVRENLYSIAKCTEAQDR